MPGLLVGGHPYRERIPTTTEEPVPDDWHGRLRGAEVRRSVWMALVTLVCALGFPAIVEVAFEPHGPGADEMAVEFFMGGGVILAAVFLFTGFVTWAVPLKRSPRSYRR